MNSDALPIHPQVHLPAIPCAEMNVTSSKNITTSYCRVDSQPMRAHPNCFSLLGDIASLVSLASRAPYKTMVTLTLWGALASTVNVCFGSDFANERFNSDIRPILVERCFDCHGNGASEGGVSLDKISADMPIEKQRELWQRVFRQLKADLMPPVSETQPTKEEQQKIESWIKSDVFQIDPKNLDPGQVTVRRLNREEYRNTIRDLMGVDYNTTVNFPADDTGHGFDNIADVLSISPLLFEKYVDAAKQIVSEAVPAVPGIVPQERIPGGRFKKEPKVESKSDVAAPADAAANSPVPATQAAADPAAATPAAATPAAADPAAPPANGRAGRGQGRRGQIAGQARGQNRGQRGQLPGQRGQFGGRGAGVQNPNGTLELSYYEATISKLTAPVSRSGDYHLLLKFRAAEQYVDNIFDYNKCRLVFKVDGDELINQEFVRQGGRDYLFSFDRKWEAGPHEFVIEVTPLSEEPQVRNLRFVIDSITFEGPAGKEYHVLPPNHQKYFPRAVPEGNVERRVYATELISKFATKAFRRPVDEPTVAKLVSLAESIYSIPGKSFESGVSQAMVAILASPRFLFREESIEPGIQNKFPNVDEYSLASRLSYFLWSSMPDAELIHLASEHKLRENLSAQVQRMMADPKSSNFYKNFAGQWLQARDVEVVPINPVAVAERERPSAKDAEKLRQRFRDLRDLEFDGKLPEAERKELAMITKIVAPSEVLTNDPQQNGATAFNEPIRKAMRSETEMVFEYIVRQDHSLTEIVDSNYTFLNQPLAALYGIAGVQGNEMRLVELPSDSPRGGVLGHGSMLAVTSNPDRTSPVKRGLFILDNLLGTPPGAPPPNIPALEEAAAGQGFKTLRESLEIHRANALCSSCHNLMDPLGLALENFNAFGAWRDQERLVPIDVAGKLITGESFQTLQELKKILVTDRRADLYRTVTEKMLMYALGRALNYQDVQLVDDLVARLEANGGKPSALLNGIIESAAFQKTRGDEPQLSVALTQ